LFKEKFCEVNLNISNLVSVCTDGALSVIGKHEGFVALLRRGLPNPETLMSFHYNLYQQNFCVKSALFSDRYHELHPSECNEVSAILSNASV